jgi:hypothetical protein
VYALLICSLCRVISISCFWRSFFSSWQRMRSWKQIKKASQTLVKCWKADEWGCTEVYIFQAFPCWDVKFETKRWHTILGRRQNQHKMIKVLQHKGLVIRGEFSTLIPNSHSIQLLQFSSAYASLDDICNHDNLATSCNHEVVSFLF